MKHLLLTLALLAMTACTSLGQDQGQGDNSAVAAAGDAAASLKEANYNDGVGNAGAVGDILIPMTYRDATGVVHPVVDAAGVPVMTKVSGQIRNLYINSEIKNHAQVTQAGTVEGSEQGGEAKGAAPTTDLNLTR